MFYAFLCSLAWTNWREHFESISTLKLFTIQTFQYKRNDLEFSISFIDNTIKPALEITKNGGITLFDIFSNCTCMEHGWT